MTRSLAMAAASVLLVCGGLGLEVNGMRAHAQGIDVQPALVPGGEPGIPIPPGPRLLQHGVPVYAVSYSPDGKHVASGSNDNSVRIWDVQSGNEPRSLAGHSRPVTSVSYSPDSTRVASGSYDNTVRIWDVQSGKLLRSLVGHSDIVTSVSYSPDGKYVVSGSWDNTVRIWDLQSGKLLCPLIGHSAPVLSVSYSPDGKHVASGLYDKTIRIWDIQSGKLLRSLVGHSDTVTSVSYSPDGKHVVSGSYDNTVRIWDVQSGKLLRSLTGHSAPVLSVSYSPDGPDGKHVASASWDKTVRIWDVQSGKLLRSLAGHSDRVKSVSYSPEGKYVVSGSFDGTVRIWDLQSSKVLRSLARHSNRMKSVSYSPDGKHVASASSDNTVHIWDVQSGKLLRSLVGHSDTVTSVSYSQDGKHVASASSDNTVRIWDAQSGKLLRSLAEHSAPVSSVSYSPDGEHVASASDTVCIWDVQSGKLLHSLAGHSRLVWSVSYRPDGKHVASGSDDNTVRIWDLQSGKLLRSLAGHSGWVTSVSYSPDGKHVASASEDNTVRIWDIQSGKLLRSLTGHSDWVTSARYSPDGKHVASASDDNTVRIWDVQSGKLLRSLAGHSSSGASVSYSPDGKHVASGSSDNTVRIWDIQSGKLLRSLAGHSTPVFSVNYSPDGKHVASGSDDNTVRIWDIQSGEERRYLAGHSDTVKSVSYSPDGTQLASGSDNTVRIWDLQSGKLLGSLAGHSGIVTSVSYSPDGKHVAFGSDDNTLRIWDIQSGEERRSLAGHSDRVTSVSYSPDGKHAASGSSDNTVRIWDLQSGKLLRPLAGHSDTVKSVSYSPDGKHVASASEDNTVRIWDLQSGKLLRALTGHSGPVTSVSYNPDGKQLASGSLDNTVRIWDVQSGICTMELWGLHHGGWFTRRTDGTTLRADDGLRFQQNDHGTRTYLDPPEVPSTKKPVDLAPTFPDDIVLHPGLARTIDITVTNRGDRESTAPAYWIHLRSPVPTPGEIVSQAQTYRSRLDGGESVTIPVLLSYSHVPGQHPDEGPRGEMRREFMLWLESAHTEPQPVTIPVRVLAPELVVRETTLLQDPETRASSLQVRIANQGQYDAAAQGESADRPGVRVSLIFRDAETDEALQETPQVLEIPAPFAAGAVSEPLSFTVPEDVLARPVDSVLMEVVMQSGIWPSLQWVAHRPLRPRAPPTPWLLYTAIVLGVFLLLAGVAYQLVFRNPTVTRLTREPAEIRDTPIHELAHTHVRLRRARRLDGVLGEAGILRETWERVHEHADDPCRVFASSLRIELSGRAPLTRGPDDDSMALHPLELPALPIPVERRTALVELRQPAPTDLVDILGQAIADRELHGRRYLFLVEHQEHGRAAEYLEEAQLRVIVLAPRDITRIALAARPIDELCRVIASQARLGDISPYQTSGGVRQGVHFFGRHNELAQLLSDDGKNHLVIGARQMGKSSLLRRLHQRAPERMHLITLTGADLDADLARAGLPPLNEIRPGADGQVPYLLMDEADKLVAADRENDYQRCRMLRAMSEEGRCRFVLAGFVELHRAAYLEHQSPVRNFANPLPLGPLDERSARELATVPMARLGLEWAQNHLVTELLARTGRRPNLIALACDAIIRALEPLAARTIDPELLHAVLDVDDESGKALAAFFGDLDRIIDDARRARIDRMVMYATVEHDAFTQTQAHDTITAAGASVPLDEVRESLSRLTLAYVIMKRQGQYIYPVPLVRDVIQADCDHDPAHALAKEVADWRAKNDDA